jgi:Chalcone isomerase-like
MKSVVWGLVLGLAAAPALAQIPAPPAAANATTGATTDTAVDAAERAPTEVAAALPQPRLQGQGRLRFLGLRVYEARLWTGSAGALSDTSWPEQTLALDIRYQRSIKGTAIAERSLDEMRRQGDIAPDTAQRWLAQMNQLFPDVEPGHRITAVLVPGVGLRVFVNGSLRGEVREPLFARTFLGIWLSPRTSDLSLRDALLGQAAGRPANR